MILEGRFVLAAPIQEVWKFLLDPRTLGSCVPGAERIEAIDDTTYECVVKQKVGPIAVKLKFTADVTEMKPPNHLKTKGTGRDVTKLGTFTQETTVDLSEVSPDEVQVSYRANISLVGRLATFGERIMRAKAKEVEREFTRNLQERLKDRCA